MKNRRERELKKIKVLYVVTRCMKSGPIQVISNIVRYMDRDKFEIYLVSLYDENANRSILSEMRKMVIFEHINVTKFDVITGNYKRLKQYISSLSPDVIHSTGLIPDYIIGKHYYQKQVIISHANDVIDYEMLYGKFIGRLLSNWHIGIMRKAKVTIACSESLSDFYKNECSLPMDYIRNGIRIEKKENLVKVSRKEIGIKDDAFVFVYTASFNKRKNHIFILDIFKKFSKRFPLYELMLLGDGPTYKELSENFDDCDNIHFFGRVENVEQYLMISDCFVSPSIQEGMPMAVLEAMHCGLPFLLSNIPQHKEIYDINNNVGELFELDDESDFINKMDMISNYKKEILKDEIADIVYSYFNAEKMSKQYQSIYESIATEQGVSK